MLPIVIHLKAKTGFSVRAVANYITEDRPQQNAPELHATDPTAVADYITREGVSEGGSINLDGLDPTETQDRDLVISQMDHIARAGQHKTGFTTNPFYHFVLSWREGENPTKEQAEQAAQHALKALGMADNQAVFAVHRDKEHHHHIHIVVNRVNPETLTLNGPPLYDYLILDKTCREIELMQGWSHDHGPHVVIDGEIHRLSRQQREELGLLDEPDKRLPAQAIMAESKSGLPSLARWAKAYVAHELVDCQTWEDLHIALARRDLRLEKLQSGLQVVGIDAEGKETRTKPSALDYRLSLGRLEKRMGAYRDFRPDIKPNPALTYSQHLENVMRGVEPAAGEIPAKTGKSVARDRKRQERETARNVLYDRYKLQRPAARDRVSAQRRETAQQHKDTMSALKRDLSARRVQRIKELSGQHGKQLALALWAGERAHAIQELKAVQQIDKVALRKTGDLSWKTWIEREAAAGDEAAQSALRGIRYREQRKTKKALPGFEGEELEDRIGGPTGQGEGGQKERGGSFGGEVKAFDLSRYEIDHLRQHVLYRDDEGNIALEDLGQRIECRQHLDDEVIRAGLLLAAQKYGGEVFITGDDAFQSRAAQIARESGIRIANPELQDSGFQQTIRTRTRQQESEIDR